MPKHVARFSGSNADEVVRKVLEQAGFVPRNRYADTLELGYPLAARWAIGWLCRERLADPLKAARAFERVLEIDPEQSDALGDLAAIYNEAGDGERLIAVDEKLLALAKEPHCAESQADGVPCPTAHNACDQCYKYEEFRQRLREGLLREQATAGSGPLRLPSGLVDFRAE